MVLDLDLRWRGRKVGLLYSNGMCQWWEGLSTSTTEEGMERRMDGKKNGGGECSGDVVGPNPNTLTSLG